MFGLFGSRDSSVEAPTLDNVGSIEKLIREKGFRKAGEIIQAAADGGNLFCQIFLSGAAMSIPAARRPPHVQREMEHYTRLAAENGDPGSQFNLAKLHIAKLDASKSYWNEADLENVRMAKYWHGKAATQGFEPSILGLKKLECFDI